MKNALQRLFDLNLPLYTCFTLCFFSKCKGFADIKLFFMHQERPVRSFSWVSLRHAIYFVGLSEKYKDTSSLCRLVSDAPETFSASPNYLNNSVGVLFPISAIPIAVGDYYGQKHAHEIVNDVTKPGGSLYEGMKFLLELVGIPTEPDQ